VTASDTAVTHSSVKLKGRHAGGGRPFVEQTHGSDLHRDSGKWVRLDRIVDREQNRYTERVMDPKTGKVLRECDHPLTDHQGHGAAKGRRKRTDE
jgi:hypothetical protein